MKNKIIILIISIFSLLGCTKKKVDFGFCISTYRANDEIICFTVKNNSEKKYAFFSPSLANNNDIKLILHDEAGNEPKINTLYLDNLFPDEKEARIFLTNEKKDSLLWKNLIHKGLKVDFFESKQYYLLKKSSFILYSNEKKQFSKKIVLLKKQLKKSGSYYTFQKNQKYTIQVEIDFDSMNVKKFLTPDDLDSLKRSNIKIFHGKLRTERIPLIVD